MKRLAKTQLADVLAAWQAKREVWVPVVRDNGDVLLDRWDGRSPRLDFGKPAMPPKGVLFPQTEVLFSADGPSFRLPPDPGEKVLFGVRSCDLMGLRQAESFMGRGFDDPPFRNRSRRTALVVLACPGPQNDTCFCFDVGSGPDPEGGYDLLLYDDGDAFLVVEGGGAGEELARGDAFLPLAEPEALAAIRRFRETARAAFGAGTRIAEAMERLRDGTADEEAWEILGEKCIACGGCVFVCPTCTCFNVQDAAAGSGTGDRVRTWDACLLEGFTREASGHNPRPTQGARLRRRHEHKLLVFRREDLRGGTCGCVGCGRCSDACPVRIGVREVAEALCRTPAA